MPPLSCFQACTRSPKLLKKWPANQTLAMLQLCSRLPAFVFVVVCGAGAGAQEGRRRGVQATSSSNGSVFTACSCCDTLTRCDHQHLQGDGMQVVLFGQSWRQEQEAAGHSRQHERASQTMLAGHELRFATSVAEVQQQGVRVRALTHPITRRRGVPDEVSAWSEWESQAVRESGAREWSRHARVCPPETTTHDATRLEVQGEA
jgi:hypothetical protein